MTGGPCIVFTRKAVVDETYISKSSNVCKSIVGIDASQLYSFSMCQDMPSLTLKFRNSRLAIIELATLRKWSCLFIKNQDQNVKLRAFLHLENRKKSTV